MQTSLLSVLGDLARHPAPERCFRSAPGLALGTTKGPIRDENQDRAMALLVRRPSSGADLLIAAISDGMGGMIDGGGAASLAISEFVAAAAETFEGGPDDLEDAAHEANFAVHRAYGGDGGATLTAAVFTEAGEAFLVHSGDSRLYVRAPDGAFALLTRDDTPAGLLAGDDLQSDMSSQLIQFVGIGARFAPRVSAIARPAEATWMLTTDGAHMIGRENLRQLLETGSDAVEVTRRLIDAAEEAGAWDNATALVVSPRPLLARLARSGRRRAHRLDSLGRGSAALSVSAQDEQSRCAPSDENASLASGPVPGWLVTCPLR